MSDLFPCTAISSPSLHSPTSSYAMNLIIMIFALQDSKSPLMIALEKEHLDIVKTLIEAEANVNHSDKVGICVLLYTPYVHTL